MTLKLIIFDIFHWLSRRIFLILWISLVLYLFYDTFSYYKYGQEFYYLRKILGLGLCISRGTATVLNLCAALILLPFCKKLNQILYAVLSKIWPGLFFFWLEKTKSIHMNVAITLSIFSVLHSISHFVNLWNFSRGYDEQRPEINFANYKNENPLVLLISIAGLTGLSMLIIILSMSLTSMRFIRRKVYNAFWYTHQLYVPFIVLLILHPLSGVLKKQIIENDSSHNPSRIEWSNSSHVGPKFVPIESRAWLWMLLPLTCYFVDLSWRICTRNRARVDVLDVTLLPGRTISLNLSCPHDEFECRAGQYVLLQCSEVSLIEWHPFTVVKVPTAYQRNFTLWIRVKGDWTESLENVLVKLGPRKLSLLVDGPFSSPMEGVSRSEIAICIAAGVGITPFVSLLHDMLLTPRNSLPSRVHLIWIVRHEEELLWIAELASKTIRELRNANRPDRLHLELYVTSSNESTGNKCNHTVLLNETGEISHLLNKGENEEINSLNPKNISKYEKYLPNLGRNNSKLRSFDENREMKSLFNPNLKKNKSKSNDNDDSSVVGAATPNLNRNNSRIQYADDANEQDKLLTPNLNRNSAKANNLNTNNVMYHFSNKIVNKLSPVDHNENDGNVIIKMNANQNGFFSKPVYNKMSSYKDCKAYNGNCMMNNDPLQIDIDTISRDKGINAIKNNLQRESEKKKFDLSKEYPLLACRVRRGRPHWDRVFGYWVHLYPRKHLNLYCCGPKKLVKLLRKKSKEHSRDSKTGFAFVHEGFS